MVGVGIPASSIRRRDRPPRRQPRHRRHTVPSRLGLAGRLRIPVVIGTTSAPPPWGIPPHHPGAAGHLRHRLRGPGHGISAGVVMGGRLLRATRHRRGDRPRSPGGRPPPVAAVRRMPGGRRRVRPRRLLPEAPSACSPSGDARRDRAVAAIAGPSTCRHLRPRCLGARRRHRQMPPPCARPCSTWPPPPLGGEVVSVGRVSARKPTSAPRGQHCSSHLATEGRQGEAMSKRTLVALILALAMVLGACADTPAADHRPEETAAPTEVDRAGDDRRRAPSQPPPRGRPEHLARAMAGEFAGTSVSARRGSTGRRRTSKPPSSRSSTPPGSTSPTRGSPTTRPCSPPGSTGATLPTSPSSPSRA